MDKLKFKTKLIIGTLIISVFITLLTTVACAIIIARQNREVSQNLLDHSFKIFRSNFSIKKEKLLADTRKMASMNDMGTKIQFLYDEKANDDITLTEDSYLEAVKSLFNIAFTNKIWQTAIYDQDGDLTAFTLIEDETSLLGYPSKGSANKFKSGTIRPSESVENATWNINATPDKIPLNIKMKPELFDSVQFDVIGTYVCIVAFAPVNALVYSDKTQTLEPEPVGFVRAIVRLDDDFVKKISMLTRTEINIFTIEGLSAGTLATYTKTPFDRFKSADTSWKLESQKVIYQDVSVPLGSYYQGVLPFYSQGACIGLLSSLYSKEIVRKNTFQVIFSLLVITSFGLLIIIPVIFWSTRFFTKPILKVIEGLKNVASGEGDLTRRLEVSTRDIIGELAESFNTFIENLQKDIRDTKKNAEILDASSDQLLNISAKISKTSDDASVQSVGVASAVEEMSTNMKTISSFIDETSTNIDSVATASEEMTATIKEIAESSGKARQVTDEAVSKSRTTNDQVKMLGDAVQEISKITETITEISEQTNLLALNATIEAARAGEAGKGFAVVATEIKELARQVAEATIQIKDNINTIQGTTDTTVDHISDITMIIGRLDDIVSGISSAIEEQSVTTSEIGKNINMAATGVQEINGNVAQSATVSDQIAKDIIRVSNGIADISSSTTHMETNSDDLSKVAAKLMETVGRFKV